MHLERIRRYGSPMPELPSRKRVHQWPEGTVSSWPTEGRTVIKVGSKWVELSRHLWEEAHGKIPKGWVIHHRDGNHQNNVLENLVLIRRAEHYALHSAALLLTGPQAELFEGLLAALTNNPRKSSDHSDFAQKLSVG